MTIDGPVPQDPRRRRLAVVDRLITAFELRPAAVLASLLAALFVPFALLSAWKTRSGAPDDPRLAGMIGAVVVAVGAALGAGVIVAATRRVPPGQVRSWRLAAAAIVANSIGGMLWFRTLASETGSGLHSLGDVAYLLGLCLLLVAVIGHPLLAPRALRIRACIDGVLVAASAAAVLWFAAGRRLHATTGDWVSTTTALAYPTLDVLLVVLCLTAWSRMRTFARAESAVVLTTASFTMLLLGDAVLLAMRSFDVGGGFPLFPETAWVASFMLLAAASWVARGTTRVLRPRIDRRTISGSLAAAPAVCAVIATIAVAIDAARRGNPDPTAMFILTAVVAMVLVRQSLTVSDNERLGESLQTAVDELELQATHDSLTGLPNRAGLTERIHAALAGSNRSHAQTALLFVDLDHLKAVNDSLGHGAGDELLQQISGRLAARVGDHVTRFGGDEFVIVLDDLPAVAAAEAVGRAIVADAEQPTTIAGFKLRPSVSVGIAIAEVGMEPEELLRRADVALYRAKSLGRRRVAAYDAMSDAETRRRVDLEPELHRALERDEFEVHYQPVVELVSGRVVGAESLLRWRHPTRGLLGPDAFLEDAAMNGLLGVIGERTLTRACADFGALAPGALPGATALSDVTVAVNLSTSELSDRRVIERVELALSAAALEPGRLTIEITEDVIIDGTIRETIDRLRELGVELAIDDFGTGNSSLRQLGSYPASTLKIDKMFIDRLVEDPEAVMITRAILGLARNLRLRTVAEGVETDEQAEILVGLGCDYAQGWLFERAVPFDEFVERCLTDGAMARSYLDSRPSVSSASDMIRSSSSATGGRSAIAPTT